MEQRLFDLGALRLEEMDEAGIDMQVLSHGAPSAQKLPADGAAALVRGVNDRLRRPVAGNPTRFAAFAALPTDDPEAAADELERCVTKLGFKGAMMHGLSNGEFLDDKRFWPIYERAEKLDVPIYLHPSMPHPGGDATSTTPTTPRTFRMVVRAAWGYTVETATQAIRMVLSGVFEKHPEAEDHPRPSRRDAAVPGLAHRSRRSRGRARSRSASATCSATTSGSPRAATSPIRR